MKIKGIKTRLDIEKIKMEEKAREHHKKIQHHIKKAMPALPKSGEEIGKSIEKRISASQKIWSNVGLALFGQKSLENVSHFSSIALGVVMIILTALVLIFPTEKVSLAVNVLLINFFIVLAGLFIVNIITYFAMRLIGSKTSFKVFFSTVNTALFMSLLVVSIPVALISFALFSTMLRSEAAITMFFSLIPFYNYLVYGWASETLAKLKGIRSVLVALVALLVMLSFNLLLPQFMA
jgi:hypothetical protein